MIFNYLFIQTFVFNIFPSRKLKYFIKIITSFLHPYQTNPNLFKELCHFQQ